MSPDSTILPVQADERKITLDVLRGFAVLGILVMNIQNFAMIPAAYLNPMAYGDMNGLNKIVWLLSHFFTDLKFMGLFSVLFGAGIILITLRIEQNEQNSASIYYRRTFLLLIFGAIHGYLLWSGDILFSYALCGLVLFLFRKASPKKLLIWGLIVLSVASVLYLLSGFSMPMWPPESLKETMQSWQPHADYYAKQIEALRGGFAEQLTYRIPETLKFQTFLFLFYIGWRAGGLMLIGMALYKWGILTAGFPNRFYRNMALIGFIAGGSIIAFGISENFAVGWTLEFSMFFGMQYNYWGSLGMIAFYIGVIMLVCKAGIFPVITKSLAAVGRMAFSNYIIQTIICTFIFYGHGLALFGEVERSGQILIVFGVWLLQMVISPVWLKYFRYGPLEWLWRSLTYMKIQPMKV